MVDHFDGLKIKDIGAFKAYANLDSSLSLIAHGKINPKKAYGFFSLELDSTAAETGVDPSHLVKISLRDPKNKAIHSQMRERIIKELQRYVAEELFDSLVDTVYALDVLNKLKKEAGSSAATLDHAAKTLGVAPNELELSSERLELSTEKLEKPFMCQNALGLIRDVFGVAANDILTLSMVATCGLLVGVRNQLGNLVGVGEFIPDRMGSMSILNISIAKGWEGYGVFEKAIEKATELAPNRRFWTAVEESEANAYLPYLKEGFRMRLHITDHIGPSDHIIIERTKDVPPTGVPHLMSCDFSLDAFSIPYTVKFDQERALNTEGYCVWVSGSGDDRRLVFEKVGKYERQSSGSNEWRDPASNLTFFTSDSANMAQRASKLEKDFHGIHGEEEHSLYSIATRGYLLLSKNDNGELVSETPLVFDMDGGVFCHGVAVRPGYDEIEHRGKMMGYAERLCASKGIARIWTTADTLDYPVMEVNINNLGYRGTDLLIDYYGPGKHRMVVEKTMSSEAARFIGDPNSLSLLDSFRDFTNSQEKADAYIVISTNYALLKKMFAQDYCAVKMLKPEKYHDRGANPNRRTLLVVAKC